MSVRRIVARVRQGATDPDGGVARDDRGTATAFVIGLVVVLFALAGLVADGGRAVNARVAITDDAEQAARVGADQVDPGALRGGSIPRIDPVRATNEARDFLVARGYSAARMSVSADADAVTVEVSDVVATSLLQLVFIDSFTVEGSATARAAFGIDSELGGAP